MKNIFKKVIAIVLVLGTLLTLCSCGAIGGKKVDLKDYIVIKYDGYSGEAKCSMTVDYEGLGALVDAEKRNKNILKLVKENGLESQGYIIEALSYMACWINVSFAEEYKNISNGDQLKVVVEVDKELVNLFGFTIEDVEKQLGLNFEATEFEIEAAGIEEYVLLDVFAQVEQYISCDENQINGEARPHINIPEDFEVQSGGITLKKGGFDNDEVYMYIDGSFIGGVYFASNGPASSGKEYEIVVKYSSAGFAENNLKYHGYKLEPMSKKYTAPEFKYERVKSSDELTAEQIVDLKGFVEDSIAEELKHGQLKDMYFYKLNSEEEQDIGVKAIVYGETTGWFPDTGYFIFTAKDVIVDKVGNVSADFTHFGKWNSYYTHDTYEDAYNENMTDPDYTFKKIS